MPLYDIVERHNIPVDAPAAATFAAAREMNMLESPVVRAIFRARELALGAQPARAIEGGGMPAGLVRAALAIGWGVLSDDTNEIVLGAVTRPWEASPVFRDILPRDFAAFAEPDFVKIAWMLRAEPVDEATSIFRTETRAIATDMHARAKFRRYWALVSPGVALIRRLMLEPVKRDAEARAA
jgi:hypothetical protein